jgi:hypothetical protein
MSIIGTVGEGLFPLSTSDGDTGYFAKWMGDNINPTNGIVKFTVSSDQLSVSASFTGSIASANFSDAFTITSPTPTSTATLSPTPTATATPTVTVTPPPGAITLQAAAAGNDGTGGTTLTISKPTGTQSGQGVNTTNPVDASYAQYNPVSSNVDNSGVTTTVANDMLVYVVGINIATTVNVPSGFTQEWSTTSRSWTTSEMSQELFPSIGATGTIHGTHNGGATSNITMLIALKPQ